jgi:hypothetical protein
MPNRELTQADAWCCERAIQQIARRPAAMNFFTKTSSVLFCSVPAGHVRFSTAENR